MKAYERLNQRHRQFIESQHMFFVATAPLSADSHINLSPKGLDAFHVLADDRVAYVDLGGSGIETLAHLKENGRICFMFCAFEDKPLILRLYGQGKAHLHGEPGFEALIDEMPDLGVPIRGLIEVELDRVQDSCGWGVPLYEYQGQRERLADHARGYSQESLMEHVYQGNASSIDGLPAAIRGNDAAT
jgi:hypothetical protein